MQIPLYHIDAFTSQAFAGNPAAVCPLDAWPGDELLQNIAAENNLSETAFFVPEGEGFRLRWFTPALEVEFCGHASLATAHVIFTRRQPDKQRIVFLTRRGRFEAAKGEGGEIVMDFPAEPHAPVQAPAGLEQALGRAPAQVFRGPNLMCVFPAPEDIARLAPDMAQLTRLSNALGGACFIATAPAPPAGPHDFVSRFFAPAAGIPEDPVTGSAHCMMAPYWAKRLGKHIVRARQISPRGGEMTCRLKADRVIITGACADYMEGRISLP